MCKKDLHHTTRAKEICITCKRDIYHVQKRPRKDLCCSKAMLKFVSVRFVTETYFIRVNETYIKRVKKTCVAAKCCSVS